MHGGCQGNRYACQSAGERGQRRRTLRLVRARRPLRWRMLAAFAVGCAAVAGCSGTEPRLADAPFVPTTSAPLTVPATPTIPVGDNPLAPGASVAPLPGPSSVPDPGSGPSPSSVPPSSSSPTSSAPPTSSETGPPSTGTATPLPDGPTFVATARPELASVPVFDSADSAEPSRTVTNPSEYGVAQVFVVLEQAGEWLRVALPVRPNGSAGWVRLGDVELSTHDYRIDVFLGDHRIVVGRGGEVLVDEPVGIGRNDRPTPGGTYYTWVLIAPTNSGYGAYAYGLSGFSEVLDSFAGGDARLGIHGTTDAASIGRDVSSGCVRVSDAVITRLVEEIGLPLGVPVEVHP